MSQEVIPGVTLYRLRYCKLNRFGWVYKSVCAYLMGKTHDELLASAKRVSEYYHPYWKLMSFRLAKPDERSGAFSLDRGITVTDPNVNPRWWVKHMGAEFHGESYELKETATARVISFNAMNIHFINGVACVFREYDGRTYLDIETRAIDDPRED